MNTVAENPGGIKSLKPLWKYFKLALPYWHWLGLLLAVDGLLSFLSLLQPLFPRLLFDYAYPFNDLWLLNGVVLAGLIIYFLGFFFNSGVGFLKTVLYQNIYGGLSKKVFSHVCQLPYPIASRWESGEIQVRINSDASSVADTVASTLNSVVVEIFRFSFLLFVTFTMHPLMTILTLISVPFYLFESNFFGKKRQSIIKDIQTAHANFTQNLQLKTSNIKTIQTFGTQSFELNKFGNFQNRNFINQIRNRLVNLVATFTNSVTLKVWGAFLGWFIGYQIIHGRLSIGELVSLTLYLGQLNDPIKTLAGLYENMMDTAVSAQRLDDILLEAPEEDSRQALADQAITKGQLDFENVRFGYQPDSIILDRVSLSIPAHSSLAIVGPSGSGKSTFINLIMRYYPALGGHITLDGKPIESYPLQSLRNQIGFVSQEIMLFPGTVEENLVYGLAQTPARQTLLEACRQASFLDVVEQLPQKLDTILGPGGIQLSGGQRQRLAIARALLRQPRILIFDEATSALDSESEFRIQETMDLLMKQVTTILIAHRLSTIKKANRIVVLDKGQIVEAGTFEELLSKKGAFFRFYNFQFGGYQVFIQKLDLELERAKRYEQSFSVLFARLANEERLRETFPGDGYTYITEEIGLFIQKTIRKIDYAVQIAGNQFAMVFPNTDHAHTLLGVERIKLAYQVSELGQRLQEFPLEFGIASFPDLPVVTGEDLIVLARKMLEVSHGIR